MGNLEDCLADIRNGLKSGRYTNEASVSQGIVLRILQALSWPVYDISIVCPEYSVEGRRVDYALCHPPRKPIVFIEVKQVSQSDGAQRQLFEYAFHTGVPMAVLTDGKEWNFFLPGEQGSYHERRVYKFDILERDIEECIWRLRRYLRYDDIKSGASIEAAREDYRDVSRNRQIKDTLPKAWAKLVEEADEILLELVADKVASLCGHKPDLDTVAHFLTERVSLYRPGNTWQTPRSPMPMAQEVQVSQANLSGQLGFTFKNEFYPAESARAILKSVFERLSEYDETFPARFASLSNYKYALLWPA